MASTNTERVTINPRNGVELARALQELEGDPKAKQDLLDRYVKWAHEESTSRHKREEDMVNYRNDVLRYQEALDAIDDAHARGHWLYIDKDYNDYHRTGWQELFGTSKKQESYRSRHFKFSDDYEIRKLQEKILGIYKEHGHKQHMSAAVITNPETAEIEMGSLIAEQVQQAVNESGVLGEVEAEAAAGAASAPNIGEASEIVDQGLQLSDRRPDQLPNQARWNLDRLAAEQKIQQAVREGLTEEELYAMNPDLFESAGRMPGEGLSIAELIPPEPEPVPEPESGRGSGKPYINRSLQSGELYDELEQINVESLLESGYDLETIERMYPGSLEEAGYAIDEGLLEGDYDPELAAAPDVVDRDGPSKLVPTTGITALGGKADTPKDPTISIPDNMFPDGPRGPGGGGGAINIPREGGGAAAAAGEGGREGAQGGPGPQDSEVDLERYRDQHVVRMYIESQPYVVGTKRVKYAGRGGGGTGHFTGWNRSPFSTMYEGQTLGRKKWTAPVIN